MDALAMGGSFDRRCGRPLWRCNRQPYRARALIFQDASQPEAGKLATILAVGRVSSRPRRHGAPRSVSPQPRISAHCLCLAARLRAGLSSAAGAVVVYFWCAGCGVRAMFGNVRWSGGWAGDEDVREVGVAAVGRCNNAQPDRRGRGIRRLARELDGGAVWAGSGIRSGRGDSDFVGSSKRWGYATGAKFIKRHHPRLTSWAKVVSPCGL